MRRTTTAAPAAGRARSCSPRAPAAGGTGPTRWSTGVPPPPTDWNRTAAMAAGPTAGCGARAAASAASASTSGATTAGPTTATRGGAQATSRFAGGSPGVPPSERGGGGLMPVSAPRLDPRRATGPGGLPRRYASDLLTPLGALAVSAVALAVAGSTLPAWLLAGALAGYALSGSV